jgi:hypothetical protein
MPSCPFCQTELPDDFGLIDCPGCEAALFIEMDGTVQAPGEASPSAETSDAFAAPEEVEGTFVDQLLEEPSMEEPMEPPSEEILEEAPEEISEQMPEEIPEPFQAQEEESYEEVQEEVPEAPEEFSQEAQQEELPPEIPEGPLQVSDPVPDRVSAADISQLANAMDEQGVVEGLRYDLRISGIDSADLRKEVYDSLLDRKLGWNMDDLMETLKDGVLEVKAVSAVKAQVVVQRLKTLPLQVRWSQYES